MTSNNTSHVILNPDKHARVSGVILCIVFLFAGALLSWAVVSDFDVFSGRHLYGMVGNLLDIFGWRVLCSFCSFASYAFAVAILILSRYKIISADEN